MTTPWAVLGHMAPPQMIWQGAVASTKSSEIRYHLPGFCLLPGCCLSAEVEGDDKSSAPLTTEAEMRRYSLGKETA